MGEKKIGMVRMCGEIPRAGKPFDSHRCVSIQDFLANLAARYSRVMRCFIGFACTCLCVLTLSCKDGGDHSRAAGMGGNGGRGFGGAGGVDAGMGDGGNGGLGGGVGVECEPDTMRDCYGGPPGTANVGACTVGSEQCNGDGSDWEACVGEVLPSMELPTPLGESPVDEDCDGMTDEPSDL